jgi:hypothetical protein
VAWLVLLVIIKLRIAIHTVDFDFINLCH